MMTSPHKQPRNKQTPKVNATVEFEPGSPGRHNRPQLRARPTSCSLSAESIILPSTHAATTTIGQGFIIRSSTGTNLAPSPIQFSSEQPSPPTKPIAKSGLRKASNSSLSARAVKDKSKYLEECRAITAAGVGTEQQPKTKKKLKKLKRKDKGEAADQEPFNIIRIEDKQADEGKMGKLMKKGLRKAKFEQHNGDGDDTNYNSIGKAPMVEQEEEDDSSNSEAKEEQQQAKGKKKKKKKKHSKGNVGTTDAEVEGEKNEADANIDDETMDKAAITKRKRSKSFRSITVRHF